MTSRNITQELLREYFKYRDGNLYWLKPTVNWINVGDIAGSDRGDGYREVGFLGGRYLLHRLIFMYHNGYMPNLIDHIDQDTSNSRIENLRPSDKRLNAYNTELPANNKSGHKGVSWCKNGKKWVVRFKHNGKYLFLGYFTDIEEAIKVRISKEQEVVCYE